MITNKLNMNRSIKYGISAGLAIALFLSTLSISGAFGDSPLRFAKYLLLIAVMSVFFSRFRPDKPARDYAAYHIKNASIISLMAAVVTILMNIALYNLNPEYSFQKFNLVPLQNETFMVINATIFFEIIVLGMISSFVIFPMFKPKDDIHKVSEMKRNTKLVSQEQ